MGKRFVKIQSSILLATLHTICDKVLQKRGTSYQETVGREVVFNIFPHNQSPYFIRIFTTISFGNDIVRECNSDAMRVIICTMVDDKVMPVDKPQKILRTAPQNAPNRQQVCIDRLVGTIRRAYAKALKMPTCPRCSAPMKLRSSKRGNEFLGCTRWPACAGTVSLDVGAKRNSVSSNKEQNK